MAENVYFAFAELFNNYHPATDFRESLAEPLSSDQIRKILYDSFGSSVPVVAYNDIFNKDFAQQKNYLRDFLNKIPQKMAVFLYRQNKNYGHWCCIFEHPLTGELYIFDSYGKKKPDEYITKGSYDIKALGQDAPYLLECFINSDYNDIIWNDHKFQSSGIDVQTCGKWCVIRLVCSLLPIDEFNNVIDTLAKKNKLTKDELICYMYDVLANGTA